MKVLRFPTLPRAAVDFLLAREAENNVIVGHLRHPDAVWFTVENGRGVQLVAMQTPPYKLILSHGSPEAARMLATQTKMPGVGGPPETAGAYAEKVPTAHLNMRMAVHVLTQVAELPEPAGSFREASAGDVDLLDAWIRSFHRDTKIQERARVGDAQRLIDAGRLYVWEAGGQPVSMAASARKTPRGIVVNLVYTPDELRGRGYATACVAALSRKLLRDGNEFCCLFTDLANPTSNAIYKKIGYELISYWQDWVF